VKLSYHIKKGTKVFCTKANGRKGCDEVIAVFATDLVPGQKVYEDSLEPKEGQGPWHICEPLACRNCRMPFKFTPEFLRP
jgi:hypothetical protein